MSNDPDSGTRIDEVADGIYRVHTPVPPEAVPGGFSFNQYLVVDDQPLLFHSGLRQLFPAVSEAIATVIPLESLAYVGVSHLEADEAGALNHFLEAAPNAVPVCSQVGAMVSLGDMADREPRPLGDGDTLDLGNRRLRWLDAPHMPHGWDCGYLFDERSRTLLCGDLFTQPGTADEPLVASDILGPSEQMRAGMDYFSHTVHTRALIDKLAATEPTTLACMHGSAWHGDGARLLRALGDTLAPAQPE